MKFPEIYFWEPEVSPHKIPLFEAVAQHQMVGCAIYVAQAPLARDRIAQGWRSAAPGIGRLVMSPTKDEVSALIRNSHPESVHIFSGMHWVPCIVEGLREAVRLRRRFGIFSEPRVLAGVVGKFRLAHSWLTEAHLRQNADIILAVGRHGPNWFRAAGYDSSIIQPFAYFLSPPLTDLEDIPNYSRALPRVGFVGRLNNEKGFSLFTMAMERLVNQVEIHVAGAGPLDNEAAKLTEQASSGSKFHGTLPMPEVHQLIAKLDVLVLPSVTTDDGWGAVVSEALLRGVAVITSRKVGASVCLEDPRRGVILRGTSSSELAETVKSVLADGTLSPPNREHRRQWAMSRLTSKAGSDYLVSILDWRYGCGQRPVPFFNDF